jgi:hypothetical protein
VAEETSAMSFTGRVGLRVTGLNESIFATAAIQREIPQTKMAIHRDAITFFYKDAVKNVHVISGKTKGSIHIDSVTSQSGIISARFGMPFEEKRGGTRLDVGTPHKTFSTSAKNTAGQMPIIIKKAFDALLAHHKTR